MPTVIEPGHSLYCQADKNLNRFGGGRYDANISDTLEAQLLDFMATYYNRQGGQRGLMMFLGYSPSMLVPVEGGLPIGFIKRIKQDIIQGKVSLKDDYSVIENAVLDVVNDKENHDGCFLVDLEGKLYNGYEVDACAYRVFDAVGTNLDNIRKIFFNHQNFGATRFESVFKALVLAINSAAGYIKHGNGFYFVKNNGGEIYIAHSINPNPKPIEGAKLNTNLGLKVEDNAEATAKEELVLIS